MTSSNIWNMFGNQAVCCHSTALFKEVCLNFRTHLQLPKHWLFDHCLCSVKLQGGKYHFQHCLLLLLSCGPVRIPAESLKCRMSSHRLQVFPWIAFPAVFCLLRRCLETLTFCNMPLPSYPFTLPSIDLMKRDRCKAAVTQRGISWRMAAGWLKNKETKKDRKDITGVMQS